MLGRRDRCGGADAFDDEAEEGVEEHADTGNDQDDPDDPERRPWVACAPSP